MADGDSKKPLPPPLDESGDGALDSLFGGLGERQRHDVAHPSGQLGERIHPTRARAARAGVPIGRMVPTSDFARRQAMKTEGVPSIGLAPPRQVDQGVAPPVQQMRQLTGLAPNSRSNSTVWDLANTTGADVPLIQFNGSVDDTDMLTFMLGLQYSGAFPSLTSDNGRLDTTFKALIKWGVGNAQFKATVDFKQGTLISLPANFFELTARCPASNQLVTPPSGLLPKAILSVGAAYGAVPSRMNRATLTGDEIVIPKGTISTPVAVPSFAVGLGLLVTSVVGTLPVSIEFTEASSVAAHILADFTYSSRENLANQGSNIFPVPGGAPFVTFAAAGASAADLKLRPFWELAF